MSDQDDISTALVGLRSRLDSLASINEANILVPVGPQARYHRYSVPYDSFLRLSFLFLLTLRLLL